MINGGFDDLPIVATGIDPKTTTLWVVISDKASQSIDVYREMIRQEVGDVPTKVGFGEFSRTACSSRTSNCDPIKGGIRVQAYDNNQGFDTYGTMAIYVKRTTGTEGFLISGHHTGWGFTGDDVGQASDSRQVGIVTVNPSGGATKTRTSDAAFVDLDNGISINQNKIYKTSTTEYTVVSKTNPPDPGSARLHTFHGTLDGWILGYNWTVYDPGTGETTTGQVAVDAVTQGGDSGGPVTSIPSGSNNVDFYGVIVGNVTIDDYTFSVFSPWQSIKSELSLQN